MTEKEKEQVKEFKTEVEQDIKKGRLPLETFAAFAILAIVAAGIGLGSWWYLATQDVSEDINSKLNYKKTTSQATSSSTADEKATWKNYNNDVFSFGLKYPATWTLSDNLPTSLTQRGTAANSLKIENGAKYRVMVWVNPDGFGAEGSSAYINYEGTTVKNKKIDLGTRKYSKITEEQISLMGPGEGFMISTSFNYLGNDYIVTMGGANETDLAEAEAMYKDIVTTYLWK